VSRYKFKSKFEVPTAHDRACGCECRPGEPGWHSRGQRRIFPFRDGLDVVVGAGATCIIQPGGSMRDQEVIDAARERGVAIVFSGVRHFRH